LTALGAVALLLEVTTMVSLDESFSFYLWLVGFAIALIAIVPSFMQQNMPGFVLAASASLIAFPIVPLIALSGQN
jgi:hypothetical protein